MAGPVFLSLAWLMNAPTAGAVLTHLDPDPHEKSHADSYFSETQHRSGLIHDPELDGDAAFFHPRRSAIAIETFGRGGLYSFTLERLIGPTVGLGAGAAYYRARAASVTASLLVLPVFSNLYFSAGRHRPYLTGGVDLLYASGQIGDDKLERMTRGLFKAQAALFAALPVVGAGYKYRGYGGFLFRISPYVIFVPKPVYFGGLTFGAAF